MSDDFTNEINRALSDLEGNAPEAPPLSDITAGRTALMNRTRRWSTPAIVFAAAAVTVLVVGIAALLGSNLGGDAEPGTSTSGSTGIYGIWIVERFTVNGQMTTMEATGLDPTYHSTPYVEITPEEVTGDTGCNDFESTQPPEYVDGSLVIGEVFASAVGCLDIVEPPLLEAMGETGAVDATLTADTMRWTTTTFEIWFTRAERIPALAPSPWRSEVDRLDCSPGYVLSVDIPGVDGVGAPEILTAIDDVVEIEGEGVLGSADPFAWGLDATDVVIAGAAPGDIEPPVIHVVACTDEFGLRPDVDPSGVVAIWVNDLGLDQAFEQTWGNRFPELCQTPVDNLARLAERYVAEDAATSLRPGGALPEAGEATLALETIHRSICASPATTGTAAPIVPPTTMPTISVCSSAGADGPTDPASFEGLPAAVAATRQALLTFAITCDFEGIVSLASESGPSNDAIFWGAGRSVEELIRYDSANQSLNRLVVALSTLPHSREEGQRVDQVSGETVPEVFYMWPPPPAFEVGGSVADVWEKATLEAVAALNGETVEQLIDISREFGGYAGFRVGIAEDGRWLFALAGD